jgi:hypothetical protein
MSMIDPNSLTFKNLSIHQLTPFKGHFQSQEKIERFITKIVKKYNDEQEVANKYATLNLGRWVVAEHHGFQAQLYFSKRTIETKFAKWVTAMTDSSSREYENTKVYFIIFLYRQYKQQVKEKDKTEKQWELFALTTADAFQVVKPYANFQFPIKVALRVLDPHLASAEKKPLAGHTDSTSETYRTDISLTQSEMETLWKWFKGFYSYFKFSSSLFNPEYGMTGFTLKNGKPYKIAVHIGVGKISVDKPLSMAQYELILEHFSRIANGEVTYCRKEETDKEGEKKVEQEDAAIRSLENIQPVEKQKAAALNRSLLKVVWKCMDPKIPLGGIYFGHRFYKDFHYSGVFQLKYDKEEVEWNYRPTISEIMDTLRQLYGAEIEFEAFIKKLENTKFKFDRKNQWFDLSEFFHGEIRYLGEVYFRVDKVWLKVNADQLIVLQRDFHNLLEETLLKEDAKVLSKPWIAKKEWAGFSLEQMTQLTQVSAETAKKYLETLREKTFTFIDAAGKVAAEPTRCLLEEEGPYISLLKKRWGRFKELFQTKQKEKKPISQNDLEGLLSTQKENKQKVDWAVALLADLKKEKHLDAAGKVQNKILDASFLEKTKHAYKEILKKRLNTLKALLEKRKKEKAAITQKDLQELLAPKAEMVRKLLDALKKKRTILVPLASAKVKKISLLGDDKIPRFPDMSNFKFQSTALATHSVAINALLKRKYEAKQPLTEKELKAVKDKAGKNGKKINPRSATSLFTQFCNPAQPSSKVQFLTSRFLVQGVLPAAPKIISEDQVKMREFLEKRYRDYTLVFEEEGYNRLYLKEDGFFVGDQSYAGDKEKVELFDILHFGNEEEDPLSAIHVKEGFGQKTREACAQIRVAAVSIDNALKYGNGAILRQFYRNVDKLEVGGSPFRKELKTKLKARFPDEDAFLKLFHDKAAKKSIQFVYAFIDDADQERLLSQEKDPARVFKEKEFLPFTANAEEAKKLFASLRKEFIDAQGRIQAGLLRCTQAQFVEKIKVKEAVKIYHFLMSQISQFDSLVAKVELIELRKFLMQLGFKLKICQLSRASLRGGNQLTGWTDVSGDDLEEPPTDVAITFEYDEVQYKVQNKVQTTQELLAHLLGVDPTDEESIRAAFYAFLVEKSEEDAVTDYLGEKTPLDYISKVHCTNKEIELVAALKDCKLVLFAVDPKDKAKVAVDAPETIHEEGAHALLYVKNKGRYQACQVLKEGESDDDESTEAPKRLKLNEVLSVEDRAALLAEEAHIGIVNGCGNDCFFNAIAQLMLHSPMLSAHLMDKTQLVKDAVGEDRNRRFFDLWSDFVLNYHLSFRSKIPARYPSEKMRQIFPGFSKTGQEDASEVLNRLLNFYKDLYLLKFKKQNVVDLSQKKVVAVAKRKRVVSQADDEGIIQCDDEYTSFLEIDLPEKKNNNFQNLLNGALKCEEEVRQKKEDESDQGLFFSQIAGPDQYSVDDFTQKTEYTCLGDELFVGIKRFIVMDDRTYKKNRSLLGIKAKHDFNGESFKLQGFVVHKPLGSGSDDNPRSGHYVAFCLTAQGWLKFDDADAPLLMQEKDVLIEANKAYVLHFKKE